MYETTMSEWLAVEAIVKQRNKELMDARAKFTGDSVDSGIPLQRKDSSLSNDVFESQSFDEWDNISHPETVPEESERSATGTTCTPTPDHRRQSMELVLEQKSGTEKLTTKEIMIEQKRDLTNVSYSDSPDDGLGDSIARQSSQERSKLDSAGDSEGTDYSKTDMDPDRHVRVSTKLSSASGDSCDAYADDEGGAESDDEESSDSDNEKDVDEEEEEGSQNNSLTVESAANRAFDACNAEKVKRLSTSRESLISPASPASNGGIYSVSTSPPLNFELEPYKF